MNGGTPVAAVVFDLDGVIVDSEPVWEEVRRAFVADHGGQWQPDSQRRLMGMSTQEWARYLSEVDAVRRLAARWPLGLASSSPRSLIDRVVAEAGLADAFAVALSTEEVERGKPAPDVYLAVAQRLGVAPGSCLAIEDSSNGLRSAAGAGMAVVAVPHPKYPPDPDALALANRVLHTLDELTADLVVEAARS
jgi:HAD superfamily hydrolase (TIGR01509 family)